MVCGMFWTCAAVDAHFCVFAAEGGVIAAGEWEEVRRSGLRKNEGPAWSCGGGRELAVVGRRRPLARSGLLSRSH